ncbi:hypothetical protein [Ktedonosporobacter rubrisoli]|nr:hypothetical protein [Ktedonosporobacter rubrisoli]
MATKDDLTSLKADIASHESRRLDTLDRLVSLLDMRLPSQQ